MTINSSLLSYLIKYFGNLKEILVYRTGMDFVQIVDTVIEQPRRGNYTTMNNPNDETMKEISPPPIPPSMTSHTTTSSIMGGNSNEN